MSHRHTYFRLYEDSIIGIGPFFSGYECSQCGHFQSQNSLPPTGLDGDVLDEDHLVGPHGGCGNCSDGSVYKKQIVRNGKLEIIRP